MLTSLAIFLAAALLGGQLNRAIYRLAYGRKAIGPWSAPHPDAPSRNWTDRIPILGWWGLRREAAVHGAGFWIRPLVIELFFALGAVALYWVETEGLLLPTSLQQITPPINVLRCQYAVHMLLISLMLVATFIDFDEQMIPDAITVPGTLAALALLWAFPICSLIIPRFVEGMGMQLDFLHFASPRPMPAWAGGTAGLAVGLSIFWLWCFAILDRRWITRRGLRKAIGYFAWGIRRSSDTKRVLATAIVGGVLLMAAWSQGGENWLSLLSSLFGLFAGGGVVWAIRIVGKAALNREAMGFGDVTLMAMIGAFLGWQPAVLVFFFAPFGALVLALVSAILARDNAIPYGPYLSLAAVAVMLGWGRLWPGWAIDIFVLGPFLAALFGFLLIAMFGLLLTYRLIRQVLGFG